jgi:hypothetical protein
MKALLIQFLFYAAKTVGSKVFNRQVDRLIDRFDPRKLVFSKVKGVIHYSHYIGQNHTREGGEKKIYQAALSFSVFNPGKNQRVLREVTLHITVDEKNHLFRLYDTKAQSWEENYSLPPGHVTGLSWDAAPEGYGLTMRWGADGIIPLDDPDTTHLHFTYLDEYNRLRRVNVDLVKVQRLPKEQIAE